MNSNSYSVTPQLILPNIKGASIMIALLILFNVITLLYAYPLYAKSGEWIGNWKLAQYFASYDYEFLKRGLVATVLAKLQVPITYNSLALFGLGVVNLVAIGFFLLAHRVFRDDREWLVPFLILLVFSPGIAMQMGDDLGRFDHLNLLVTLCAISLLIVKKPDNVGRENTIAAVLSLLLMTGLLIHEAFLFMNAPLILALSLQRVISGRMAVRSLILCLLSVLITLQFIIGFGGASTETLDILATSVAQLAPEYKSTSALWVWEAKLLDNLGLGVGGLTNPHILKGVIIALIPWGLTFGTMLALLDRSKLTKEYYVIISTPLAVAPLFLLGLDYSRWVGAMIVVTFLVCLVLKHDGLLKPLPTGWTQRLLLLGIILCSLYLGPVGVDKPFPKVNWLPEIAANYQPYP